MGASMSRLTGVGAKIALAAATLGTVVLLAAVVLSHYRGYHVQWVASTGCELIVDRGDIALNRYGTWTTPDGGYTFAALPAAPPGEIGWGVMRFYYPTAGLTWG